jgi:hypothetical protein
MSIVSPAVQAALLLEILALSEVEPEGQHAGHGLVYVFDPMLKCLDVHEACLEVEGSASISLHTRVSLTLALRCLPACYRNSVRGGSMVIPD